MQLQRCRTAKIKTFIVFVIIIFFWYAARKIDFLSVCYNKKAATTIWVKVPKLYSALRDFLHWVYMYICLYMHICVCASRSYCFVKIFTSSQHNCFDALLLHLGTPFARRPLNITSRYNSLTFVFHFQFRISSFFAPPPSSSFLMATSSSSSIWLS